jgi:MFS transporter, putative metabolite:H+ symporter
VKYISVILIGVPIWYVVGILVTFSPEFGAAMGMSPPPNAGRAVMFTYIGLAVGDLGSGWLSQILRSRKRVVQIFVILTLICVVIYFLPGSKSLTGFYTLCGALGFATGYWAVFVTIASEQFGTNIRATATTTVPNFVRGAVVPLTLTFQWLTVRVGVEMSGIIVGAVALALAFVALAGLEETYGKDLDYVDH